MSSLHAGTRIADRYVVDSVLASGGMGVVYRASDTRLSRQVAIKVLLAELGADARQMARFEREAIASARLSHPGIVQVHDFGKTDAGLAYLVMELIHGRTLANLLDASRIEVRRALDLTDQALAALSAAHGAGIVHRDLKPANLMLVPLNGGREHVKVLDFGIAQLKEGEAYTRLTATGDIIGTPSYMSPEQARGEPCDARTDVYAMGMVLWSCLTGQRPFHHKQVAQMVIAVQTEIPKRADVVCADVPKAVAGVVEKAIAKRAEDWFASAADLADALQKASSAVTPATRAPLPATAPSAFAHVPSPSPSPSPALSPVPLARAVTPVVLAPAPTPAAPPKKKRWWLRILLALLALGALAVLGVVILVVAVGVLGLSALMTLPNAQHPAAAPRDTPAGVATAGTDPTCAAAARCCRLAEDDGCEAYLEPPLDLAECRAAIGTYGDQLTLDGEDASPCSPAYRAP